jgi:hypothetical protein
MGTGEAKKSIRGQKSLVLWTTSPEEMFHLKSIVKNFKKYFIFSHLWLRNSDVMKNILLLFFGLIYNMLPAQEINHRIADEGKSLYNIVVDKDADSTTFFAANELQDYLYKISGAAVKITNKPDKRLKSFFVGSEWFTLKSQFGKLKSLSSDGFCIFSESGNFYLAGNNSTGNVYAVYALLQDYAGCFWFGNGEQYIPVNTTFSLPEIIHFTQPDFAFRHPHFPDKENPEFYLPARTQPMDNWGMFVHTFHKLMPPDIYFDKNPEYYSLVNGKRIRDGQLCLSNQSVIDLLSENLSKEMAAKPECKYWSVSQNDCINYCECDHCQALYDKFGSISGAYVSMANQIARQFPRKYISTLAYQFTRSAPTAIVPDSNVNIMFCSIECNRSQPLETDLRSRDFVKDMKDWAGLTHNIFMWDYVVQFKTYTCPFPNFDVLQKNIQFFHKHGVPMMFQQGSGGSWSDFSEYKQALIARLLWDVNLDEPTFRQTFFNAFYGAAAPIMLEYFSRIQHEMEVRAHERGLDIYGYPIMYSDWFLKPAFMHEYKVLMDNAEALVVSDPVRLIRVLRQRCSFDFAFLDIALNLNDPVLSFYRTTSGVKEINPEMAVLLDRFVENCSKTDIISIDENGYSPAQYRAQAMNIAAMAIKPNKAAGKTITSTTPYSPLYNVGGEKALTDGLFGGQHFRLNWLGYQGNDMELLIDFGSMEKFSKVEANFFLDLVSWIFLPLEIIIEVSEDGQTFAQVYCEKIPEPVRNFGQKPVHFSFDFQETNARYLKMTAISHKTCPDWHRGANQPAWIFIDELVVE